MTKEPNSSERQCAPLGRQAQRRCASARSRACVSAWNGSSTHSCRLLCACTGANAASSGHRRPAGSGAPAIALLRSWARARSTAQNSPGACSLIAAAAASQSRQPRTLCPTSSTRPSARFRSSVTRSPHSGLSTVTLACAASEAACLSRLLRQLQDRLMIQLVGHRRMASTSSRPASSTSMSSASLYGARLARAVATTPNRSMSGCAP